MQIGDGSSNQAAPGHPSPDRSTWHGSSTFLLVVIAGLLIARIPVIFVRFFDPDEFEHSHAAWSVFRGLLPYKDFFEHHTPWYYFALSPFFRWFSVDQSFEGARRFLIFGRALSLGLTALSVVLVFLIGRLGGAPRKVGLLAGIFLAGQPALIQKTLEIRPDVLALPLFLGGLWFLMRGLCEQDDGAAPGLRWFLGGGLCLGGAIMCTQKMLFVLPGALTGLGLWALAGGRRRLLARSLAVLAALAGIALPGGITWAGFAVQGGGAQFVYNNFLLNARWAARSDRHLLETIEGSYPMLIACLVGVAVALRRCYRTTPRHHGDVLLLTTLGGLMAGIWVVPVTSRQYYIMPLAIACVFAARGLCFLVELARRRARPWLLAGAIGALLAWSSVDLARSFHERGEEQTARLRFVFQHTGPGDSVLDGWLGTQVFRPHPLYYSFMHGELMAMLSEKEKDAYIDALESGRVRPSLITLDVELKAFGARFLRFVRTNYTSDDGLFYLPVRTRPP